MFELQLIPVISASSSFSLTTTCTTLTTTTSSAPRGSVPPAAVSSKVSQPSKVRRIVGDLAAFLDVVDP